MNKLKITSVEATENKLMVHFDCTGLVGRFFTNNLFVSEYDTSIEGVPEAILIIPFLATSCPIVWASQAEIYVETIDETFLNALKRIKKSLQNLYPKIGFSGNIHADKIVKPNVNDYSKSMMLFSGGVDSLTTYIRHRSEDPFLVSIYGADVDFDNHEAWDTVMKSLERFSNRTESKLMTIRSNFKKINDNIKLASYYHKYIIGGWWGGVKHGLALLGLCAPITYIEKIKKLYIAASLSPEFSMPWGSHPDIDNNVRWAGTIVEHDGYELTRQEKMEIIAEYIQKENPELYIRSCYKSTKGVNCSKCEKCSRTITGLEMVGIDPNEHGYDVNADTFTLIREKLSSGKFKIDLGVQYEWEDIQRHGDLDRDFPHSEAKDLVKWLLDVDIGDIKSKSNEVKPLWKYIIPYLKYLPDPVFRIMKYVYQGARSHIG